MWNKKSIQRRFKKSKVVKSIKRNTFKHSKYIKLKRKEIEINQKNQPIILNLILNGISLLLFIISYYCYYLSLEKCFKGEDRCSKNFNWIKLKLSQYIISVVLIIFLFALIIYKIISKLHLIHFIMTFICFYNYSHSVYFHDHGLFNFIGLFFVLFLSIIFLFILKIFLAIVKNKFKYKFIAIFVLLLLFNVIVDPYNCDDWAKGLNNTYIENDVNKYGCQIQFPKKCVYKLIGYTQDLSFWSGRNCSNKGRNARKNILRFSKSPYINKNTLKFGFPLTNNAEGQKDGIDDIIIKNFTKFNLLDMDNAIPQNIPKPEYIVDFSKDPLGELTINVNFNESLSKERKELEKNSEPYSENILIIFIDSVSRVTALRKLKKSISFFEQFISYKGGYNRKYPNENFHSFQFFKYHSFRGFTWGNIPKLFYGNDENATDFVRISKYLNQNGYVTCYATDYCQKDNTRIISNLTKEELYDHQLLLCDPNEINFNSVRKRCLYGQVNSYHLFEYSNQFWRKYPNNRKFSLILSNDGHEPTLEVVKYTDDIIYNFLNSLYNDNLLKDTTIFLMSDHGNGMPSVYYYYKFFDLEKRLPMLFIIINDRKNLDYNQQYFNIRENQQTFITAFDIYNTFGNIIYGDKYVNIENKTYIHDTPKSPIGQSLFEKINPKIRSPKNYTYMNDFICI